MDDESKANSASSVRMLQAVRISSEMKIVPLIVSTLLGAVRGVVAIDGPDGVVAAGGVAVAHAVTITKSGATERARANERGVNEMEFMAVTSGECI
jgi:hypothetical protein